MPAGVVLEGRARVDGYSLHTQHRTQYKWLPSPSLPPSWLAPARSLAARSPPRPPTAPARPPCARHLDARLRAPAPQPTSTAPSPGAYLAPRRRRDATRARGSIVPGARISTIAPRDRALANARDATRRARLSDRPPSRRRPSSFLPPRPARSRPAPLARDPRHTAPALSNPSHSLSFSFFPQRLRLRSPRSRPRSPQPPRPLPGG